MLYKVFVDDSGKKEYFNPYSREFIDNPPLFGIIPNFAIKILIGIPRRARLNLSRFNRSALRANFSNACLRLQAKFGIISSLPDIDRCNWNLLDGCDE